MLKRQNSFEWIDEWEAAFKELKSYLSFFPLMVKPKERDNLQLYLLVSKSAVSFVLVQNEGRY